jgi:hypothetical protein
MSDLKGKVAINLDGMVELIPDKRMAKEEDHAA